MADKRISDFDALGNLQDEDVLLVSSEGETYKLAAAKILDFIVNALTAADVSMEGYTSYVPREGQDIPDILYSDTVMEAIRKLRAMLRFEKVTAAMKLDGYTAPDSTLRPTAITATDTINAAVQKIAAFLAQHDIRLSNINDELNNLAADDVTMEGYTQLVPRGGESVPAVTASDSVLDAIRKAIAILNYEKTTAALALTGYTAPDSSGSFAPNEISASDTVNAAFRKVAAFINKLNADFDDLPEMIASNVTMDGYSSLIPRGGEPIPDILPADTVLDAIRKLRAIIRFESIPAKLTLDGFTATESEEEKDIESTDTINGAFSKVDSYLRSLSSKGTQTLSALDNYILINSAFQVAGTIKSCGMKQAFRMFIQSNAPLVGLDEAVLRFFTAASACANETYASTFYRYSTSSSPVGWKEQANANLVCEPSTNETAGRDDYADLPLFACFDCNYTIDAQSLEPVIHAIKDVYGEFSAAPSDSFVGVLQMTGWIRRTQTATTKTLEYAAYRKEAGFRPLPEAVRISDNSVRPFVIHAKYAAGWNSQGKLSSVSGVMPAANRPAAYGGINASHDTQTAKWRAWGNQYAGGSICDLAFLQTMLEIKYANLGSWNVMAGSRGYTAVYTAKVSESGVTRVLVTPEEAEYCVVGSGVSIGSGSDRTAAAAYDVCAFARITAINYMTVDGVGYGVVQTDAEAPFNVTANETTLLLQPWLTGTTDAVKGSDGSPFDNRSGKEPFKLQGVEVPCMYEVLADVVLNDNPGKGYTVWANRRAENIGSGKGTNAVSIGLLKKRNVTGTTTNNVAELNWLGTPESYMLVQSSAAGTTPITTGYCAPLDQYSINVGDGNWRSYRAIGGGVNASLAAVYGRTPLNSTGSWADTCRACGTAGNRGVYSE